MPKRKRLRKKSAAQHLKLVINNEKKKSGLGGPNSDGAGGDGKRNLQTIFSGQSDRGVEAHALAPALITTDLTLEKSVPAGGGTRVDVRVEAYNLLNRTNLDIPSNDPDGEAIFDDQGNRIPTAGKIFATSTDAREMQVAIRFTF